MHPETVSSQEVPDYCGERTEAKALGDLEGLARAESDVKQRTRAWVKRKGAEEDQNWRPRKRHRLSSAQWLREIFAIFGTHTCSLIKTFKYSESKQNHIFDSKFD